MRILVVDDDKIYCSVVSKKLAGLGGDTSEALDGLSAWQLAQDEEFDLALIDLGLPGLDGLSLIEMLRNYPKTKRMPIIVITGRDDRETIDAAFAAGSTLFLTKPINWSLLSYQVNCVMRLTRSEQEAREAHQRARAESRIKDSVIGRLNNNMRPVLRELATCAQDIQNLTKFASAPAAFTPQISALLACTTRLENDLANMVTFAESIGDEMEMHSSKASVASLIEPVVQYGVPRAKARNVALQTEMPSEALSIRGNSSQLSLALQNLVDNAIRVAPSGSEVLLRGRILDDGSFYFSIDDEGCGIAPETLVQLLTPMLGKNEAEHSNHEIGGMGLVVAKRIAEYHGGSLTIRSAVGRGTTAIMYLPADRLHIRQSEAA